MEITKSTVRLNMLEKKIEIEATAQTGDEISITKV